MTRSPSGFDNPIADKIWNDHLGNNAFSDHKRRCNTCSIGATLCETGDQLLTQVVSEVTSKLDETLKKGPMTETPDNVIPENELAHRRRVLQLSEEIVDLLKDIADRASEYRDLSVPTRDWIPLVLKHAPVAVSRYVETPMVRMGLCALIDYAVQVARGEPAKMNLSLENLDGERDEADDEDDDGYPATTGLLGVVAPLLGTLFGNNDNKISYTATNAAVGLRDLIEEHLAAAPKVKEGDTPAIECVVLLRGAQGPAVGALSRSSQADVFRMLSPADFGGRKVMMEQFFTCEDIVSFALARPIEAKSSLFTS